MAVIGLLLLDDSQSNHISQELGLCTRLWFWLWGQASLGTRMHHTAWGQQWQQAWPKGVDVWKSQLNTDVFETKKNQENVVTSSVHSTVKPDEAVNKFST